MANPPNAPKPSKPPALRSTSIRLTGDQATRANVMIECLAIGRSMRIDLDEGGADEIETLFRGTSDPGKCHAFVEECRQIAQGHGIEFTHRDRFEDEAKPLGSDAPAAKKNEEPEGRIFGRSDDDQP
jgi:hypothetical protein